MAPKIPKKILERKLKLYCVYKITHALSGKAYVGKTFKNASRRWRKHKRVDTKKPTVIQLAIQKYGVENFTFEVLHDDLSEARAYELEAQLILELKTHVSEGGYNTAWGGMGNSCIIGGFSGRTHTAETREKLRAATTERYKNEPRAVRVKILKPAKVKTVKQIDLHFQNTQQLLNMIRSGKSLKNKEVASVIKDTLDAMTLENKQIIQAFLLNVAQAASHE